MVVTKDRIIDIHIEDMAAKKYHLVFLIMAPVFILMGMAGGNIIAGLFLTIVMTIYMIVMRMKQTKILRKLEKGDFTVSKDILVDKYESRVSRKSRRLYILSEKKYIKPFEVLPHTYEAVEIGDEFIVVEVNNKFVMLFSCRKNIISEEISTMILEN